MFASTSPAIWGLPLSLDPIACVLGLIAIWLAWIAFRSSSQHLFRIERFESGWLDSIRESECGPYLQTTILNVGLPVHNLRVYLRFLTDEEVPTRWSIDMSPDDPVPNGPFDRGMRGTFVIRPLHRDPERFEAKIITLRSPRRQEAEIVIRSGNYEVAVIPLVSSVDTPLRWWNAFALHMKFRMMKTVKVVNGISHAKTRDWFPIIGLRASHYLATFVEHWKDMLDTHRKIISNRRRPGG